MSNGAVLINSDIYSMTHAIVIKRNENIMIINVTNVLPSDLVYSYTEKNFVPIENITINTDVSIQVYSINVEPNDFYFTEHGLTFDFYPTEWVNGN